MSDTKTESPVKDAEDAVEVIDANEDTPLQEGDSIDMDKSPEAGALAGQLMKNPQVLAALQGKLEGMIGTRSGYIENLPKNVKRRLKALKKIQFEGIKVESAFYREVHELECKYALKYAPLYDRRSEIVSGGIEPTDSDCDWPSDEETEEEKKLIDDLQNKAKVAEVDETGGDGEAKAIQEDGDKDTGKKGDDTDKPEPLFPDDVAGVPEFWLTIFKNVDMLADMVQEHDEPILRQLQDIKVVFHEADPMGFTLEFYFNENEHFKNRVLTKQYIMRADPDADDPFAFEGPEIIKCLGCKIDWNKNKNVTVKVIKKTQKHKGRGTKRTVTKSVQNDSFFNFFQPPPYQENDEMDEEAEAMLAADFEIGHYIRERIVPRAVLYFTGDALDDDDDYEEEEEEEESEGSDDDYDEDADEDFVPPAKGKAGQEAGGDCKQQ